jgi:hypothetical protein
MSQSVGRQPPVTLGTIVGGALGVVGLVPAALTFAGTSLDSINLVTNIVVAVGLVGFLVAGLLTMRATGEVGAGTLAGLVAGAVFAALSGLGNIGLALFDGRAYGALLFAGQPSVGAGQLVLLSVLRSLTVMLLYAGLGAGIGGLGALLARRLPRARDAGGSSR